MQRLSSIEKMGDKRSATSYWNMKEEWGGTELHVPCGKTNDRNERVLSYRGADKSLARPGRKQARKHVKGRARFQQHRDASCHQVFFFFSCKAMRQRKYTPF